MNRETSMSTDNVDRRTSLWTDKIILNKCLLAFENKCSSLWYMHISSYKHTAIHPCHSVGMIQTFKKWFGLGIFATAPDH